MLGFVNYTAFAISDRGAYTYAKTSIQSVNSRVLGVCIDFAAIKQYNIKKFKNLTQKHVLEEIITTDRENLSYYKADLGKEIRIRF